MAAPLDRASVTQLLADAGCIAASQEADELIRAAAGNPDVLDDWVSRRTSGEPIAWLIGSLRRKAEIVAVAGDTFVPQEVRDGAV